ncbi:hypothetical protein FN846DRAFT_1008607 [Sphaerosporella brunnea]|uniref:DUF7079 domain-containing protein n=1 Tax=Sphaerosporella brunnea TaxID=1250544 RepID=A0A5J5F0R8_9PEZI|nr:hypothetical protein FN846DRAFT_1008607 [Sphaerosporella brunnea]
MYSSATTIAPPTQHDSHTGSDTPSGVEESHVDDDVLIDPAVNPDCTAISAAEQQACVVLSVLFLDTEVTESDISDLAHQLHGLDLENATLRNLLCYDLFPVLWGNIMAAAGEWAWFDAEWLLGAQLRVAGAPGRAVV